MHYSSIQYSIGLDVQTKMGVAWPFLWSIEKQNDEDY